MINKYTIIRIISQGYVKKIKGGYLAHPNVVLIEDSGKKILVDPGTAKLEAGGWRREIDYIFLTHYHPDHFLNIRLFPKVKILDGGDIYNGDKEIGYAGKIPGTNIKVVKTPGHSKEHSSLLVNTKQGMVAVAGDVFWTDRKGWQKDIIHQKDEFATNRKQLIQSRKKLIKLADWIIPGHGEMFRVKK